MEIEKLRKIAYFYYRRKDIQKAIIAQVKNREVVPTYLKQEKGKISKEMLVVGKRPDAIEYESDLMSYVQKGATSFHISEEIWQDPLKLSASLTQESLNKLRIGWDLILDIDCPYLEYSKIAASLLCEALRFHNIENFGLKFSGRKGWHIGLAFDAFPKKIQNIQVKDFFPQGPRIIASYLKEMIKKDLAERILEISTLKEISASSQKPISELLEDGKFNPYSILEIDTTLIAPRHLYRAAYSLNEISGLVSCVINPEQLKTFHLNWAKPERVFPKPFLKQVEKNEASELLLQAIDWYTKKQKQEKRTIKTEQKTEIITKIPLDQETLPPCIKKILEGMKQDGRKRALFVLINFSRSLGTGLEELEKLIEEWNKKNYKPLRESYIKAQLNWFKKQEPKLPPNCKQYYQDLMICEPDNLCNKIKNPVSYAIRKARLQKTKRTKKLKNKQKDE
ncbi:MAG: hypothetical protein QXQ82_01505 [Candidatus Pacearchaeota archaeon]